MELALAPKAAGFDPDRIGRITDHLNRNYIENGKIAGCQTLVARHGHVAYYSSLGSMDRERAKPMADDTIFRIDVEAHHLRRADEPLRTWLLPAQ
jgi:CubicO group peptidase (beta-lactamase class C family)